MTIRKIIAGRSPETIVSCSAEASVAETIETLANRRIGAMPVMRGGTVVGIISERDVIYRLASDGRDCLDRPVAEIMTSPAMTVEPSATIDEAMSLMTKRRFRHFPVVDNGQLIAFISIGDLVKWRIDEVEQEANQMRDYIQTV